VAFLLVPSLKAEGLAIATLISGAAIIPPLIWLARRSMPKVRSLQAEVAA